MRRAIGVFALSVSIWASAHAAHPLVTEDPHVQDTGNQQIEINTDRTRHNGSKGHGGVLTYSYGISQSTDFVLNLPRSLSAPAGMMDLGLGVKWRVYQHGPVAFALKPELLLPTGDPGKELGNGLTSGSLLFIGAYQHGAWELLGNVGIMQNRYQLPEQRSSNHATVWRASMAVLYAVNAQWRIVADAGLTRNDDKANPKTPAYLLAGVIYSPSERLDLDAGLKQAINCKACSAQTRHQFGAGVTLRF